MATELNQPVGPKLTPNTPPAQASAARPATAAQNAPSAPRVTGNPQNASEDTVSISARGLKASVFTRNAPETRSSNNPPKPVRDVTEDNQIVVKFVDPENNEVVRQIPSEEFLRLKEAVGDLVEEHREDS
ncbi:flagellar protein FlaG [Nitrospina watsonii]|uniref:FlaG protein n=1 Tax=Nitrospina watsonii TaxID=1323948 RepID=A0ABM9HGU8_9BACT|nr:flagellar protein FlaG [Nitrospina watsonii]CAI2719560.1 Putative FlaG protein [Nitrospina watsonii]